ADISVTKTGIYISEEYKLPENLDFMYGLAAVNDKIVVTGSEKVSPDDIGGIYTVLWDSIIST
ncbi:MAG: hypothetical protein ACI4KB_10710, partial [Oscillospiraceae bacterium]